MSQIRPIFVYVIEQADTDHYKVGTAANPAKRLSELQVANPTLLLLQHSIRLPGRETAEQVEFFAHSYLAPYHARGEWFFCPTLDIAVAAVTRAGHFVRQRRNNLGMYSHTRRRRNLGVEL